jgi:hypothetical protein
VQGDVPLSLPHSPSLVRPRTAGEILDDAGRLYLADAPLLLALSALFNVPAAAALLVLLTQPRPESVVLQLLGPALTAALLPLTGLASGACQEVFRRRAERGVVGLGPCLGAALRGGLDHVAARAPVALVEVVVFCLALVASQHLGGMNLLSAGALLFLSLPLLGIWVGSSAVHPILTGREGRLFHALGASAAEATRHAGKALAVNFCRLPLLVLAVLNLLAAVEIVLWVAGTLGGLDTSTAAVLLSENNPTWLAALTLLAWLLLGPFAEASNFLLHVDGRARYEGLDLWYRVQQCFPLPDRGRAAVVLLALGSVLALVAGVHGADRVEQRLQTVRAVRQELERIRREVEEAKPYPGGNRWAPDLERLARRLDPAGGPTKGPYRWFYRGVQEFTALRDQPSAVQVLTALGQRLDTAEQNLAALAEEPGKDPEGKAPPSKEEIKDLVSKRADVPPEKKAVPADADHRPPPDEEPRPRIRRDGDGPDGGGPAPREGPGMLPAAPAGGFGAIGWIVLLGLLLAVVVVAGVLFFQHRGRQPPTTTTQAGKTAQSLDDVLSQPQPQTAATLFRQAEELAGAGKYLEAVRLLYAAVLAGLHRASLIRYEATRTNGEYVDQLQGNAESPDEVHEPFRRLTGLFELKWYGERACRAEDYHDCRGLAERIRGLVS